MKLRLLLLVVLIGQGGASAALTQYACQTKEWWRVNPDTGTPEKYPVKADSLAATTFLLKPFYVDRASGHVLGSSPLMVSNSGDDVTVLSRGSAKQTFTVLYVGPETEGGRVVTTLTVDETAAARLKPFIAVAGTSIYTGMCE